MGAVLGDFYCAIGAGYVADATEVAFCQVYVDFGFFCRFTLCFGLFLGGYGSFGAGKCTDLAADTTVFVKG